MSGRVFGDASKRDRSDASDRSGSDPANWPRPGRRVDLTKILGNQAVQRTLQQAPIAAPDSSAERVAAALSGGELGRMSGLQLARIAQPAGASHIPDSAGTPVAPQVRGEFEETLGADLSSVVIHDDPTSHEFARNIGARAATCGSHIYFAKGRFAPHTSAGHELLHHELVHTLQPEANAVIHRTPDEDRLREIQPQLDSSAITDDFRAQLERERAGIMARGAPGTAAGIGAPPLFGLGSTDAGGLLSLSPDAQPISVVSMSEAEYEAMTGMPASALPEGPLPMAPVSAGPGQDLPPMWPSAIPGSMGAGSLFTPQPNWYYRVLSPTDPTVSNILGGADLLPRAPDPGFTFQPAASPAEMTFRHMRPGGNVPQVGTDRISTAGDIEAFQTLLSNRGTGELVRVDVDAARRLGQQFLEQGDIMAHLNTIERDLVGQLEAARLAGRGRNFISRLEGRLTALRSAREYAQVFQEGQGVGRIPSGAITDVPGASVGEAAAREAAFLRGLRFFRYGGRVLLVVGAAMSVARIATAPEDQMGRVATQEAGGWAFSLAGGAIGAKGGAALGGALGFETGPGAIIAAAIGGLIGAAIGFFGGEAAANEVYDAGEDVSKGFQMLGDTPRLIETSVLMFGSDEDRRNYYQLRELETGEPSPWDL